MQRSTARASLLREARWARPVRRGPSVREPLARCRASRQPACMATPITVTLPHQLGRAEARRRIEGGFAKITHALPGGAGQCSERWDGDRLVFSAGAIGQTVAGVIDVGNAAVTMEIQLPGVLGLLASGLEDRLQKAGQLLLTKK